MNLEELDQLTQDVVELARSRGVYAIVVTIAVPGMPGAVLPTYHRWWSIDGSSSVPRQMVRNMAPFYGVEVAAPVSGSKANGGYLGSGGGGGGEIGR